MTSVIVAGLACVAAAIAQMDLGQADIYLGLISAFTVGVGSRVTVKIPRVTSYISVSDTFIFLVLILYGGEFAVILAALEALASSWRFCHKRLTLYFNAATMAISTSGVVLMVGLLREAFNEPFMYGRTDNLSHFFITLSVVAVTQFLINTALAAVQRSLVDNSPLWQTWKSKYIWTFLSYFIGAASAGIMVQISRVWGFGVILASLPVMFFVFLTYRMYLKNVEMSMHQADQAEQYAKVLETQAEALRESEERFRTAFDHAPIGIGLVSPSGKWVKANRALTEILGYTEAEFLASDFQSMIAQDDLLAKQNEVNDLLAGRIMNYQMEHRYIHKSGRTVWTWLSASATNDAKNRQSNLIFQLQDITEKKLVEENLQRDATHDALTGLPNRALFMSRLAEALAESARTPDHRVSVLFIDLDRFKYVNDSLGHLMGDEMLKGIAARLRECLRPSDLVARLGGDEFTVLVEGRFDNNEVVSIAERIQKKFDVAFDLGGHEVFSSASIGILYSSESHQSPEDVMRDADTAMYQAKRAGKARHEVFDEDMHRAARERLKLETDLRRAVERDEIQVYYQPIYDLRTGRIDCFESLARWEHAELGWIPPSKFIPLAEEIGLIDPLCAQVLRKACTEIGLLGGGGPERRAFAISVNLSCRQFGQNALVQTIRSILDSTGFAARDLKLEITESVFFEHHNRAIVMLNQLRDLGIEINIDDFGTGYSNLGYLKKLPITSIKLDRSFVSMITESGSNDEIVRAIITLAGNLGLTVIAEGIETPMQLHVLRELECEGGQGYLFGEPMSFDTLKVFLAADMFEKNIDCLPHTRDADELTSLPA